VKEVLWVRIQYGLRTGATGHTVTSVLIAPYKYPAATTTTTTVSRDNRENMTIRINAVSTLPPGKRIDNGHIDAFTQCASKLKVVFLRWVLVNQYFQLIFQLCNKWHMDSYSLPFPARTNIMVQFQHLSNYCPCNLYLVTPSAKMRTDLLYL